MATVGPYIAPHCLLKANAGVAITLFAFSNNSVSICDGTKLDVLTLHHQEIKQLTD